MGDVEVGAEPEEQDIHIPKDEVTGTMQRRRWNIRGILRDPALRRELMVTSIVSIQSVEGITTTREQAEQAYDKIQREKTRQKANVACRIASPNP